MNVPLWESQGCYVSGMWETDVVHKFRTDQSFWHDMWCFQSKAESQPINIILNSYFFFPISQSGIIWN